MDQHPVPQNISSYEFRLVGDMTLKQFFQLAGGALVGFILFKSPLPDIIKWPLIILSVGVGILLAFVPINGRPFSQWIMAFIKAVYSPTEYYWSPNTTLNTQPSTLSAQPAANDQQPTAKSQSPVDSFELQMVSYFKQLYDSKQAVPPPAPLVTTQTLTSKVDVLPVAPPVLSTQAAEKSTQPMASDQQPTTHSQPPIASSQPPIASVPYTPLVRSAAPVTVSAPATTFSSSQLLTPEHPNLIAGQVSDPTGKPLEGAILEITDAATNLPVRAMRSNKLGQFQTATPLKSGSYTIMTEKDGFTFATVSLSVQDKIISPLLIQSQT